MASYYDFVLGLIPLALFGVTGTLHLGGLEVTTAVLPAGVLAVAVVVHALFVRTPIDAHVDTAAEAAKFPTAD